MASSYFYNADSALTCFIGVKGDLICMGLLLVGRIRIIKTLILPLQRPPETHSWVVLTFILVIRPSRAIAVSGLQTGVGSDDIAEPSNTRTDAVKY